MWYILYMNKDVIYVEPEDDITDIILKIENSKEKIVALVPPKKAGVFRSVVNIKLIAKSGATANKKVVLVTVDPSIVRLAASAKIPVTKNLQTPPTIPTVTNEDGQTEKETLVEESDGTVETEEDVKELEGGKKDEEEKEEKDENEKESDKDEDDDKDEKDKKDDKASSKNKSEKKPKEGNRFVTWFKEHKKLAICGGICAVLLIVGLVWALVIAPAVTITVGVKANSNNFSEAVTFTEKMAEENASEGKFYLEEKKVEDIKEVEFEATGKKNVGEKAKGEVTVVATISKDGGAVQVKAGDVFSNGGLNYTADSSITLAFDGKDKSVCGNVDDSTTVKEFDKTGCKIYAIVKVTAAESGAKYNISARDTGWDSTAPVATYSTNAMSGGTDKELTVVQQSDIDKAKESLAASDEAGNKEKLLSSLGENMLPIDSSFKQTTAETISTPGVGEEVKEGVKPKLKAVTSATVKAVDKTKVEEFITKKANLKDDQRIYEMKDPFVENFSQTSAGYSGKLKTTYLTGPKITVSSVVDAVKGKGIGDAQHTLKDIEGVSEVKINASYPWVMSVPNDSNKITVDISVKDQSGADVKVQDDKKDEKSDKTDEKKSEDDKKQAESKE